MSIFKLLKNFVRKNVDKFRYESVLYFTVKLSEGGDTMAYKDVLTFELQRCVRRAEQIAEIMEGAETDAEYNGDLVNRDSLLQSREKAIELAAEIRNMIITLEGT